MPMSGSSRHTGVGRHGTPKEAFIALAANSSTMSFIVESTRAFILVKILRPVLLLQHNNVAFSIGYLDYTVINRHVFRIYATVSDMSAIRQLNLTLPDSGTPAGPGLPDPLARPVRLDYRPVPKLLRPEKVRRLILGRGAGGILGSGRLGSAGKGADLDQVVAEYPVPAPDGSSLAAV
jgi:hypothetical protein